MCYFPYWSQIAISLHMGEENRAPVALSITLYFRQIWRVTDVLKESFSKFSILILMVSVQF